MNKTELIKRTNEVGLHFMMPFRADEGVAVGTRFYSAHNFEWAIGRIDNVTYSNGLLHVEGRAVRIKEEA